MTAFVNDLKNLKYMWLSNSQNIRMRKYNKGWVVEIQRKTWYGMKYWTHLISVAGIESEPWYFSSYSLALNEATKYFRWELIKSTQSYLGGSSMDAENIK